MLDDLKHFFTKSEVTFFADLVGGMALESNRSVALFEIKAPNVTRFTFMNVPVVRPAIEYSLVIKEQAALAV